MKISGSTRDLALLLICAAIAGCTGAGGGGGPGPTPTPPIPAGDYYVNAGLGPVNNEVFGLSTAPIAAGAGPTALPGSPYSTGNNGQSGAPFGIALANPSGTVLYAVNDDAANVTAFPVNADGSLGTAIGPYATTGAGPSGICIDPTSTHAAVANTSANNVELFTIAANGALTPVSNGSGNGLSGPIDCAFSSNGFLYVTNSSGTGGISAFSFPGNALTPVPSSPFQAGTKYQGIVVASGVVFAASQISNNLFIASINVSGQLVSGSNFATDAAPIGVTITPNGKYLYVAAAGARVVDGYSITGTALSPLAGSPYQTQANKTAVVSVNGAGTLLVALDEVDFAVTVFAITSNGTLGYAPINEYSFNSTGNPLGIVAR